MLRLTLYMLTTARKKTSIKICFSDSELENMKQVFLEKTGQALSKNDVLCAHMFSIITDLDDYGKRPLSSDRNRLQEQVRTAAEPFREHV